MFLDFLFEQMSDERKATYFSSILGLFLPMAHKMSEIPTHFSLASLIRPRGSILTSRC